MQVPLEVFETPSMFGPLRERIYDYVSPELCYNNRCFKLATDSKVGKNWGGYHPENNPEGMKDLK